MHVLTVITPRAHARSVVKQSVHVRQCVSQCVTVSHQHFGLIILNTSLHHSNSGNSDKTKCMVYLKVGEAV